MGTIMTRIVLKRHWTAESEAQGAGGLVPEADKARIRELLPAALADPSAKIRTQAVSPLARARACSAPCATPALGALVLPVGSGVPRVVSVMGTEWSASALRRLTPCSWHPRESGTPRAW